MAEFKTSTERRSQLNQAVSAVSRPDKSMGWQDDTIRGIIKAVQWPSFPKAVKNTLGTMSASVVIGIFLYFYGFCINQLIAFLQ